MQLGILNNRIYIYRAYIYRSFVLTTPYTQDHYISLTQISTMSTFFTSRTFTCTNYSAAASDMAIKAYLPCPVPIIPEAEGFEWDRTGEVMVRDKGEGIRGEGIGGVIYE